MCDIYVCFMVYVFILLKLVWYKLYFNIDDLHVFYFTLLIDGEINIRRLLSS